MCSVLEREPRVGAVQCRCAGGACGVCGVGAVQAGQGRRCSVVVARVRGSKGR